MIFRYIMHIIFYVSALRTETQISMNFVPWKEIEMCEKTEASQTLKVCKINKTRPGSIGSSLKF